MKIRVRAECPLLTVRASLSFKMECVCDIPGPATGAPIYGRPRIHHKLVSASQTKMRTVVANASGASFMVGVIGILLRPVLIDIVWIPLVPSLDGMATFSANVSYSFSHFCPLVLNGLTRFLTTDAFNGISYH
jgi:hypothetical protein